MTRLSNPAPQHFDSLGIPLSGGKLFFYEPGSSTTLKDTFSDVNLSIPNSNPVILDSSGLEPNIYLDGTYRVVLQDKNGVQRWERDNVNQGSDSPFALWIPTIAYGDGGDNIVTGSDGNYYVSTEPNNLANDPTTSPGEWDLFADVINAQQTTVPTGQIAIGGDPSGFEGINTTVKGSLPVGNGTTTAVLALGAEGTVPKSRAASATGIAWEPETANSLVLETRTSNTILTDADAGKLIKVTSGTFTQTFQPVLTLTNGWFAYYQNAGTGLVTLDPDSGELIDGLTSYVMYPGEARLIQCDGTKLTSIVLNAFSYTFTSSGTFTKPPGYNYFGGLVFAGGGGGFTGGNGGGGGACVQFALPISRFSATETVTIGAGGATASLGGNTTLGTLITSYGGGYGSGTAGGGGGGALSAGGAGSAAAGRPFRIYVNGADTLALDGDFGGGYGSDSARTASVAATSSIYGGGGGSGSTGGSSTYGGGGGGATGGASVHGGSGGSTGANGTAPSGGGGTGTTTGARGELRIWGVV